MAADTIGMNDVENNAVQLIQIRVKKRGGNNEPQSVVVMARKDSRRAQAVGEGKDTADAIADGLVNVTKKLATP